MINQMRITFPAYTELAGPWFKQQNGYYCGPATVKQVLHYINNVSSTQDTYASELGTTSAGTDMTGIPGVLNSHISGYEYNYYDIGTAATYLYGANNAHWRKAIIW